ncbi:flagellar filament capping protein FliD [Bacillus norwichensis]|uniref:Flagellar hook-associated protein 2 n=1 Tax=Bacillus norwichensis TaxID=2762217 RepID=A0ABR8VIV5_9BACI|nr:flagellar filament capping protein FliD [Bacillus norwichensis]MBD8004653.1 flagellar filament capping protein FliD [Bacillus norwichensis]
MRIGGLASGMDIDQLVKDMMGAKRVPLDKMKQQKQILEWKRDDYRTINTMLLGFRNQLGQLKLTSNYRARMVSSTNEEKISATVTSGASQASYTVSKVEQLATAANRVSGQVEISATGSFWSQLKDSADVTWEKGVAETKHSQVKGGQIELDLNGNDIVPGTFSVNGKSFTVITAGEPAEGQVLIEDGKLTFNENEKLPEDSSVKIDYALKEKTVNHTLGKDQNMISLGKGALSSLSVTVGEGTEAVTYVWDGTDNNGFGVLKNGDDILGKVDLKNGNILFELPPEELPPEGTKISTTFSQNFTYFEVGAHTSKGEVNERIFVTGNESLNNVIRKVNESSAGITMFFDEHTKKITMTRKETGNFNTDGNEIFFSGGVINKVLNFENSNEEGGQNAIFTINGLETERNSNTFSMNGVTITLKQTLKETDSPITVNVSNDSEGVLKTVKEFVDQYNALIDDINKKLNEERNRSYLPLTDDEREGLSDRQQEKWEDLARSGLLKGDPLLSGVLTNMRMDMYSTVETNGLFKQLSAIGITTTKNYLDGGKLEINEEKLKEAIEKDPDAVENLFRGTGSNDSDRGVIHKLYDSVNDSITKIQDRAGRASSKNQQFALGRELISVDKNIASFETRLKMQEERLWRQFTAMEKAIQRANDQSLYLMQQFGGM